MKGLKTAGILLVVLLIMSGIAYWDEQQTKKEEKDEKSKNKIFSLSPSAATRILYRTIDDGEELEVILERSDNKGTWQIKSPVQGRADTTTVSNLLKSVLDYKYEKIVAKTRARWPDFGLQEPTRIIRVEGADQRAASLHLGAKAPVGYSVYSRSGEADDVLLGSQHILTATAKTLRDFRDKTMIESLNEAEVTEIRFQLRGQEAVTLKRGQEQAFEMTAPLQTEADQDEARDLIASVATQKVEAFIDHPEPDLIKSFEESERWAQLTWIDTAGEQKTVLMSDHAGKFWMSLKPQDLVFQISDSEKAKYEKDVLKLRNRRILEFDSDLVNRVDVDGTDYRRVDGEYYLASVAEKAKADDSLKPALNIRTLVEDLEFAKTQKFLTKADVKTVLDRAPKHRIKLWHEPSKGQEQQFTVDVYPEESGNIAYIQTDNQDSIYVVPERVFSSLSPDSDAIGEADADGEQALEPLELDSLSN